MTQNLAKYNRLRYGTKHPGWITPERRPQDGRHLRALLYLLGNPNVPKQEIERKMEQILDLAIRRIKRQEVGISQDEAFQRAEKWLRNKLA